MISALATRGRKWWVWPSVLMTMDEALKRFGEMFRDVLMIWRPDDG